MRIFKGLKEAVKEIERDLHEMGVIVHPESYQDQKVGDNPDFETKELQGYCYKITQRDTLLKEFQDLGGNQQYIDQEVIDRLSTDWRNPGEAWKLRKDVWEQFIHDGKFAYTYNERIRVQLARIIEELHLHPNTRQAVITMYDQHLDMQHLGGKARIPCSMYYQFLRRTRGGEVYLDVVYTMRSCDLYTHLIYDIVLTMLMQEWIANTLQIVPGYFTHFIGSLHAYRRDWDKGVF